MPSDTGPTFSPQPAAPALKACAGFCILDERRDGKDLPLRQCSLAYLVHGAIDEQAQGREAAFQHRAGRASHAQTAEFQRAHRHAGGRERVAELVYKKAGALPGFVRVALQYPGITLRCELQHGVRDGVVEAPVQRAELIDRKGGVALERQVRDGLAKVAIVVNDLVHRIPQRQQTCAVCGRAHADLGEDRRVAACGSGDADALPVIPGLLRLQRSDELVQDHRDAVRELGFASGSPGSCRNFRRASRDQLGTVVGQENVHHRRVPVHIAARVSIDGRARLLNGSREGISSWSPRPFGDAQSRFRRRAHASTEGRHGIRRRHAASLAVVPSPHWPGRCT